MRATFPTKPSHTTTSQLPKNNSFPSILPVKFKFLSFSNPGLLEDRYDLKLDDQNEPLDIMDAICRRRGFLLKGGELDYDRCARTVLDEFRKGKMGRITLELPE